MRYLALATDYDGTLTADDALCESVLDALERLRRSGRRLILVTGRRLDDLLAVCARPELFDLVVAENGAVLYSPQTRENTPLAAAPSQRLIHELRVRGVEPLEIGQIIVATHAPHRSTVQDVIWALGLEVQVIGNRGAVMMLPAGINKASGLEHALRELALSRHEVVGVGDAENDHSFLRCCECAVAVADAAPSLKDVADLVTIGGAGAGVVELVDELILNDLERLEDALSRHAILLGRTLDGSPVRIPPYGHAVLVAGPSGCGKSTVTAGLVEGLIEHHYQVCILDPEGDHGNLRGVVTLGNHSRAPGVDEVLSILEDPEINLAVNLLGVPLDERPEFFTRLLPSLQAMRARTGRPHWLIVDEAHHLLPTAWGHAASVLPAELLDTLLVTVDPRHVSPAALSSVHTVLAIGDSPDSTFERFASSTGRKRARSMNASVPPDCLAAWFAGEGGSPQVICPQRGQVERIRHRRKYAEGDLGWHSFWFRGPNGKQNLKAQNLHVFCQLAAGIDEATWSYHLHRGDYSRWFREAIGDDCLADETALIEHRDDLVTDQTRDLIRHLVYARYTLPA